MFKASYQYRTKRYKSNIVVAEDITVYKKKASSTDVHKSRNHNSKISYMIAVIKQNKGETFYKKQTSTIVEYKPKYYKGVRKKSI